MYSSPGRKKARPSNATLVWSAILFTATIPLAWLFFSGYVYIPLFGIVVLAAIPSSYRFIGLRRGLPSPYGAGRVSILDSRSAFRGGILLVVGGFCGIVLLLGSVFIIPVFDFFVIMFSLTGGLPLSQIAFFLMVFSIERTSGSRIYVVTDETTQDGTSVLERTIEMLPVKRRESSAPP